MAIYTFECNTEENGCGLIFERVMSPSTYTDKQVCPNCKKRKSVHRHYESDTPSTSVKLSDEEITVGHLAARNNDRFSDDYKKKLNYEHNKYKLERPRPELPSGMNYLKRSSDGSIENFTKKKEKVKNMSLEDRQRRAEIIRERAKKKAAEIKKENK